MRCGAFRTGLCQRGDARCHRVETGVHSVLVECRYLGPTSSPTEAKPFARIRNSGRQRAASILHPRGLIRPDELPPGWLLEHHNRQIKMLCASRKKSAHTNEGFRCEMNLLLASLRRVEIRIEPKRLPEFLKWKNRMAE